MSAQSALRSGLWSDTVQLIGMGYRVNVTKPHLMSLFMMSAYFLGLAVYVIYLCLGSVPCRK